MYIKVRVKTGQKECSVDKINEDTYIVSVREKAENNMANRKVFEVLSDFLKLDKSKIRLVTGHKTPNKIFTVD